LASRSSLVRKSLKKDTNKEIDWIKIRNACLGTMGLVGELLQLSPQHKRQGEVLLQVVQTSKQHLGMTVDSDWLEDKIETLEEQLTSLSEEIDPETCTKIHNEIINLKDTLKEEGVIKNEESDEDDTV